MYIVTGGAGFIGSNIVAALEARADHPIVVCDRLRSGNKWRNLSKRELADLVPPEALFDFLDAHAEQITAVFHMGAISSTTERDADLILRNNFKLSSDLWRWCTIHQVPLIYASSAATYGDGSEGFEDSNDRAQLAKLRPLNPYGWSKHLFDRKVARDIAQGIATPPQWVGLKFFNVYGPNEYHKGNMRSVAEQVFHQAKAGEVARLFRSHNPDYADGGQLRDFIWVEDCVHVMMWMLDHPSISGIFNCGTGQARSFLELTQAVFAALVQEPRIEFIPTPEAIRERYQYFTEATMARLRTVGYDRPFTSLEDGVAAYVTDYLDAPDPYR